MKFVQMKLPYSVLLSLLLAVNSAGSLAQNIETTPTNTNFTMPKASLAWLTLDAEAAAHWIMETDSNSAHMRIHHRHMAIDANTKHILVLIPKKSNSYRLAVNTLLKVLQEHEINVQLTTIHFNKDSAQAQAAINLAEQQGVNLIFAVGSISVQFVHENYRDGDIPVVTVTNKDPVLLGQLDDYDTGSGTNIAYTSLNVPIAIQLQYLFELKLGLRTVGLLYNQENAQTVATEVVPAKKAMLEQGLVPIDVAVKSATTAIQDLQVQIPAAIETMRKYDPNLRNSLFWITGSTAVFTQIKLINQLTQDIPVLGSISNVVTEGDDSALMAIGIDRRNNAHLAGLYAVQILKGESKPGDLKLGVVTPPDLAINFRIAKKIGLQIPLHFFEGAAFIYDYEGRAARSFGQNVITQ